MFQIKNAKVDIYNWSKKVSGIHAELKDQPMEVLKALGRGKMSQVSNIGASWLRYDLPEGLSVYLDTN